VPLHEWTSAHETIPLPAGHRFPIEKYERLRDRVIADALVAPERLHEPARVPRDVLLPVRAAAVSIARQ